MADNKTNKNQRKILSTAEEEFLNSKEQLFEQVMNEKFLQLREMVAMVSASEELPVVERIVEVMRRRPKARRKRGDAWLRRTHAPVRPAGVHPL